MSVSAFLDQHFRHFNARELVAAARAYQSHLNADGKMLLAMAGAMNTAEIGISLAKMIRAGNVHAISCTAANLEEDVFNLVAHDQYKIVPNYRDLTPQQEEHLRDEGFNRVTDIFIPETVMRHLEGKLLDYWQEAATNGQSYFPCEYFFRLLDENVLQPHYQIPVENSWLVPAHEAGIPVYSPGYEDSTLGNILTARVIDGSVGTHSVVRTGTEQMAHLVDWYLGNCQDPGIGFFQIGGGIAGDFAICAVPLILQDLRRDAPLWSYFAKISDSTTSYGSYSGAVPNEKITWFKLDKASPKFMIHSDASIVAPLIFAYVLGE
jgi:deoxyhypusine synthase